MPTVFNMRLNGCGLKSILIFTMKDPELIFQVNLAPLRVIQQEIEWTGCDNERPQLQGKWLENPPNNLAITTHAATVSLPVMTLQQLSDRVVNALFCLAASRLFSLRLFFWLLWWHLAPLGSPASSLCVRRFKVWSCFLLCGLTYWWAQRVFICSTDLSMVVPEHLCLG